VAANFRDTISVVDTKEKKLVKNIKVGVRPHPGRGANIDHPKYGPIWCTGHLGDNTIQCIGTDPVKHPQYAWKVVVKAEMPGEGGGNLFIKTHPKSPHLWADRALHNDKKLQRSLFVFDKTTFQLKKVIEIPPEFEGRAVHLEYNKEGNEVWVAVWGKKEEPQKQAILVYDDKTLTLKKAITGDWVATPTGHFNVYNTMKDLY
jgi:nitrite reductase (NO-forming)/hydroxylamine reductase